MKAIGVPDKDQVNGSCTNGFKKGSVARAVTRGIGRNIVVFVDADDGPTAVGREPLAVLSLPSDAKPCADAIG